MLSRFGRKAKINSASYLIAGKIRRFMKVVVVVIKKVI